MSLSGIDITIFIFSAILCHGLILFLQRIIYNPSKWSSEREFEDLGTPGKQGTPIYGGIAISLAVLASSLPFIISRNALFLLLVLYSLLNAGIGFLDDRSKLNTRGSSRGLSQAQKYFLQFGVAILFWFALGFCTDPASVLKNGVISSFAGSLNTQTFIEAVAAILFLVFMTNCTNILDGMDGLVAGPVILLALFLSIAAFLAGSSSLAATFHLPYSSGAGSIHYYLVAVIGAVAAFLWHNAFPARLYMGDTGSLFLGSSLAATAVILGVQWLYAIAAAVLILQGLTSLVQSYLGVAVLGRRIFFRAPLHHSMYFKGTAEPKVVVRIWLLSFAFTLLAALLFLAPALRL